MASTYLEDDQLSKSDKMELAETMPQSNHSFSKIVTVKFEKGGRGNSEDALWSQRSKRVPFSDDPIYTYKVDLHPGDHFLIRGKEYVFKGVNQYDRKQLLFRPLDEEGEETEYTSRSPFKQINKDNFADAFGSGDDIYFECQRIDPRSAKERTLTLFNQLLEKFL